MPVTNYYTVEGEIIGEKTTGQERIDYLTDPLGSVYATLDQTGQIVNTYRYKPYGGLLAKTGTGADPSFGWVGSLGYRQTGKKWSAVYVRAREYDTGTGRWTSRDPVDDNAGGLNLYAYAANAPTRVVDPSGLQAGLPPGGPDPGQFMCGFNPALPSPPAVPRVPPPPGGSFPGRPGQHGVWLCCRTFGFSHCFISTQRCGAWGFRDKWEVPVIGIPLFCACSPGVISSEDDNLAPVDPRRPGGPHIPGHPQPGIPGGAYSCVLISGRDAGYDKAVCDCIERSRANPPWYCVSPFGTYHCQDWVEECLGGWPLAV